MADLWQARPRERVLLVGLVALAFALRVHALGEESFWLDEANSVRWSRLPLAQVISRTANDVHPPLYPVLLHGWMLLVGQSEFAVRFLSVIPGVASVALFYRVSRRLAAPNVSLLAVLLLALAQFHVNYSQEARNYSLLMCLTLGSFDALLHLYPTHLDDDSASWQAMLAYLLVTLLLLYTQVYALFVFAAHNAYWAIRWWRSRSRSRAALKRWVGLQTMGVVGFLPWITVLASQVRAVQSGYWLPRPDVMTVLNVVYQYSGSVWALWVTLSTFVIYAYQASRTRLLESVLKGAGRASRQRPGPSGGVPQSGASLGAASAGFKDSLLERRPRASQSRGLAGLLLTLWLLAPHAFPFLISQFATPVYLSRGTIPALPAFFLALVQALSAVQHRLIRFGLTSALVAANVITLMGYYPTQFRQQWREAARQVDTQARPGDHVLFYPSFGQDAFDFYSARQDVIRNPLPVGVSEPMLDWEPFAEGVHRVWLIVQERPDLQGNLRHPPSAYSLVSFTPYFGVDVYLFTRTP
jgi:uncharacterized membrane protein